MSSLLSIKLKQRARVLAAGAAITAITLAMLPGVAEAQEMLDADIDSTVGGSVGSAAPADGGSEPISTETDAVSVNEVGEDGANSDTGLTSDNTAPVPASVEATGDAAVESPVGSQNVEVCGDLNADACTQEAPAGESGADGGNTADGGSEPIITATDLAGNQDVSEDGANGDTALVSDNTAPVPASGVVTADGEANTPVADQTGTVCIDVNAPNCEQQPAGADGPADGGSEPITSATDLTAVQELGEDGANGNTALNSDNTAPVPASGVATGDAAVTSPAGNQNVEACGDLNSDACPQEATAGGSGADGGTAPTSDNPITSVTDLTGNQELGEEGANGDTALNSDNTAPVPASGVVTSDVAVDSPAGNQNVEVCGDLNADACPQETATGTAPTSGNPITSVTDLTGDQELGEDGLVGDTALNSENTAPVPASGVVTGNGNVTVPGVANEDLGLCATLNQNACTEEAAAPGNNAGGGTSPGNGIDVDSTTGIVQELANGGLNGDTSNNTVINAPVPVNGSVVVGGNATVDEIANQNVGICLLVNQAGCGSTTTPPAGGGNAGGGGTPPNSGSPITSVTDIVGNQNVGPGGSTGTTVIDSVTTAPVPASVLVNTNGNAAVDGILNQGIDACLAVNANCGQATVPPGTNPGGGGTNPGGTTPIGTTPVGTTPIGTTPGGNAGGGNSGGDNAGSVNNGSGNNGGSSIVGTTSGGNADGTTLGNTTSGGNAGSASLGSTAPGDSANSTTTLGSMTSGGNADGTTLGSTALGGAASSSALALAQQPSAGGSSSADGGSQASAISSGTSSASSGSSSASSDSQEEASTSLPSTGGVSPLLMITMLLLIGAGIFFLLATMKRTRRLNS